MSDLCVDGWLERVGPQVSAKSLLFCFEQAMDALWAQAQSVLGEIMLGAIGERVLRNATERYAFLATLKLGKSGITSVDLDDRALTLAGPKLREGLRFTLIEFLTVTGALTGDILSPPMEAELLKLPKIGPNGDPPKKGQ